MALACPIFAPRRASPRRTGFWAAAALAALPVPAAAAEGPTVLLLPFANLYGTSSRQTGERLAEMLRAELDQNDALRVVGAESGAPARPAARRPSRVPRSGTAVPRNDRALGQIRRDLADAREFLRTLKFKQAADLAASALQQMESNHAHVDFDEFVAAHLDLAVAQFRIGKERDGERTLAIVARLEPHRTLGNDFPPVFQRIFDAIKRRLSAQAKGAIRIESNPSGASTVVDGRDVGQTPILVKDLIPGFHFVKLTQGGTVGFAAKVDVAAADVARLTPDLGAGSVAEAEEPAPPTSAGRGGAAAAAVVAALANNTLDDAVLNKATDAASAAAADFVVLGGVHRAGENLIASAHLFDVRKQRLCPLVRVSLDPDLLGAGLEIYKLGSDLAGKLFGCEGELVPAKVARDAATPEAVERSEISASRRPTAGGRGGGGRRPFSSGGTSGVDEPERVEVATAPPPRESLPRGDRRAPIEDVPRRRSLEEPERPSGVRRFEARTSEGELQRTQDVVVPVDEQRPTGGTARALLFTAIALVVAGGAAAGAILVVSDLSRPASGKATIRW